MTSCLQLTKELISCPSITPDDANCQDILITRLKQIGFTITKQNVGPVSNFYAQHGTGSPNLGFAGHTDVVPTGDLSSWRFDPFTPTIDDDFLYGRGAQDMKGGVAAMVVACEQFVKEHPEHKGSLSLLITSAEEGKFFKDGTPKIIDYMNSQDIVLDYCIVGEPSSKQQVGDIVRNGRRGSLKGYLSFHGVQGHVAYPHLAKNPIHLSTPVIQELISTQWDQGNEDFPPTTMQCSNINAGTGAANVTPNDLFLWFSFRFSPEITAEEIQQRVAKIVQQHGIEHTLNWELSGNPFYTPKGILSNAVSEAIEQVAGFSPDFSTAGGTSDGRFIAPTGAQVIELGVCNDRIHQIDERVPIADLEKLTTVYQRIIEKIL